MEILIGHHVLIATQRSADWHICLRGNRAHWECGNTLEDAIESWKRSRT